MNQWTPENISGLLVALAAVITAIGAVIHSKNTRKGITNEMETSLDKETERNDNTPGKL